MKEKHLHKIHSVPGDTEDVFGQKAEDTLRKLMQASRLSMESPGAINKIATELQQLAVQRSIRKRRRMVFLWTLLSLLCGSCALIFVTWFSPYDRNRHLTRDLAQNAHQTVIGGSPISFWILPLLGLFICMLLVELLLASFKSGRQLGQPRQFV